MKRTSRALFASVMVAMLAAGCKKDHIGAPGTGSGGQTKEKYAISGMAINNGTAGSSYVLTADNLSTGTISITGNGIPMDLGTGIVQNNTVFSFGYGLNGQGPVVTLKLGANGQLVQGNTINLETVNALATFNKDALIACAVPRDINSPTATFTVLDAVTPKIRSTASINTASMLSGSGEMAYFTGLFQVDDKVFAPFMSIKGTSSDPFGSNYLNNSWIAVFSYPDFTLEKIIKDDRTSYIGAYFGRWGVAQTESGDVYSFSTAVQGSVKPSAVLRINKGATAFDTNYFFNLETASGGSKLARMTYVTGSLFLAEMYADPGKSDSKVKLAMIDVDKQTVTWISGSPTYTLGQWYTSFFVEKDKTAVELPITTDNGVMSIYTVNVAARSVTKGADIKGLTIVTDIDKLSY